MGSIFIVLYGKVNYNYLKWIYGLINYVNN